MNRRGFTAPEFALVFAIIAFAMAFLVGANAVARGRARDMSCMSNVKQLGLGLQMYAADNNYRLPPQPKAWDAVHPHIRNLQILRCPQAQRLEQSEQRGDSRRSAYRSGPPEGPLESDYLLNPTVQTDDLPTVIIAGDDVPDRHSGRRWVGVRLDGATGLWPAEEWAQKLGEVSKHAKDDQ